MPSRSTFASPARSLVLLAAIALPSCTTTVIQGPGAGLVAQLSLERFLEAANARDIPAMGRLFGTEQGPVMDTGGTFGCMFKKIGSWFGGAPCLKKADVEVRLAAIADILKHDDYRVLREEPVAGRLNVATRIWVDLTVRRQRVADVPFVVVRSSGGRWLVEEIDLQRVLAGPRRNSRGPSR